MVNIGFLALSMEDIVPYPWLQIPALIVVIGIIVGWIIYRRKQM